MNKNFDGWNEIKKEINATKNRYFYKEREIWWCSIGINIGFEEDGKGYKAERPVLIIKGFSKQLCWAIPLSTIYKKSPYYFSIGVVDGKNASAMISQMKPLDTRRLTNRIGYIDTETLYKIKQVIKNLF